MHPSFQTDTAPGLGRHVVRRQSWISVPLTPAAGHPCAVHRLLSAGALCDGWWWNFSAERAARLEALRQDDVQETPGRPVSWEPSGQSGIEGDEVRLGVH